MAFAFAFCPGFAVRDSVFFEELAQMDFEVRGGALRVGTKEIPKVRHAALARHITAVTEPGTDLKRCES